MAGHGDNHGSTEYLRSSAEKSRGSSLWCPMAPTTPGILEGLAQTCRWEKCAWWVASQDGCALNVIAETLIMMLDRWNAQDKRRGYT